MLTSRFKVPLYLLVMTSLEFFGVYLESKKWWGLWKINLKIKFENDLYIWALPELSSSLVPPCPGPYSGKAHSLGCLPYNRCALKNPLSEKDFFNRRLLFSNWPLCLTMYVSWWSCSLIVIVLFCRQEACFTLRASFLTRNMRGQFALVMLIFFWGSLLWTSFWPWKLLHPTKALMCSRPSRLLVFR